jgi:hypothetical protein
MSRRTTGVQPSVAARGADDDAGVEGEYRRSRLQWTYGFDALDAVECDSRDREGETQQQKLPQADGDETATAQEVKEYAVVSGRNEPEQGLTDN